MLLRVVSALLVIGSACLAKERVFTDVSFADIFRDWDRITAADPPGLTIMTPQRLHFIATYAAGPRPCNVDVLQTIFVARNRPGAVSKTPVSHCIELATKDGRRASVFVRDVLVTGLERTNIGGSLDIRAALVGYVVKDSRDRNAPVMLIERFRPVTPSTRVR